MLGDEELEVMKHLGLTLIQAKTYIGLSALGASTISSISKSSQIARQDIYRVMPNLMKLGLVERVLKNPATYKALPVKDGLSLLLQKRKEEYDELQKKASLFLSNAQRNQISKNVKEAEDTQFAIIYDQTLLFQKYEKYNLLAEKTIDCSGDWQGIKWLISLCNCSNDLFTQAMKKGVRIRIITEERDQDNSVDKNILGMNKNPSFGIRFVAAPIPLKLVLYDGKEAYTSISTSEETDMPMMWSINPNFVGIMAKQFDQMWEKGAKFSPYDRKIVHLEISLTTRY